MSMNLYVFAKALATLKTKTMYQEKKIKDYFDLWQTPTEVSLKAENSDSPLEVYLQWLRETWPEETVMENIWGDADIFEEGNIVGQEEVPSPRVVHEIELSMWLREHEDWEICWEAW